MDRFDRLPMKHLDDTEYKKVEEFFEKYKNYFSETDTL